MFAEVMGLMCQLITIINITGDLHDNIVKRYYNLLIDPRRPRILFNDEDRGGRCLTLNLFEGVGGQIMRATFVITGFLSGWWCALALIQPLPPPTEQLADKIDVHHSRLSNYGKMYTYNYYQVTPTTVDDSNGLRVVRSTRVKGDSLRERRKNCRRKNGGNCRGKNWCPYMDISNRAFLSPTVFEGKARSMSSSRRPGSNYAVTFEVKQVYKSQSGFQPLRKNDSVRLHFRDKVPKSVGNKSSICRYDSHGFGGDGQGIDNYEANRMIDYYNQRVIRADIKRGKVYLVFVNRVGPRNFTILGEPVLRSKKNEQAVQAVVRPDYVREVTLSELRDSVARTRERVKLVCRTRGSPPPRVHWLKDGVPLNPRRGLKIQHKRRRSKLVIISARPEDSGRYECIAQSSSGYRASLAAQLLVVHDSKIPDTTTSAWPRQEQPCPIAGDFCMNGGTCLFFETVGEPACRCTEGFTGLRCETKDVISTGSVYNRHRAPFSCKLGLSTSYYC
ncbi:protein vein [Diachasma alloeum]|uniref:protein vein n=1 Tax=Diachasma alloeum TaxID=454923 RepID=UPI0007384823|nr:protein vein [Diachasma alloeum]